MRKTKPKVKKVKPISAWYKKHPKDFSKVKPKKVKKVTPHIVTKGIKTAFRPSKKQLRVLTAMEKQKQAEKKIRITDRGIPVTNPVTKLGNFDDDSDWRLKAVHHNINQAKRAIYDLSINVEGEHDHISKTIARCHDRIEHVEGLVIRLSEQIDGMVRVINKYGEKLIPVKYDKLEMTKEDAEERIRAALKNLDRE